MRIKMGDLRAILLEAPQTAPGASAKGLALYAFKGDAVMQAVIYDPTVLINVIHDRVLGHKTGTYAKLKPKTVDEFFNDDIERHVSAMEFIKGMLTFAPPARGQCYGGWTVRASAAEKGFGPLIYDIAMGLSPGSVLIPDRDSTSQSAGNIWKFYKSRRADVKAMPLDDIDNPRTKPEHDDCALVHDKNRPELDFAYQGVGSPDVANLDRNHKNVIWVVQRVMKDNDMPFEGVKSALEEMIGSLADNSFFGRYLNT